MSINFMIKYQNIVISQNYLSIQKINQGLFFFTAIFFNI